MKIAEEITPDLEQYWAGHDHQVVPFAAPEGLEDRVGTAPTVITKNLDDVEAALMGSNVIVRVPWRPDGDDVEQLRRGGVVWLSMWGSLLPHQIEVQPAPLQDGHADPVDVDVEALRSSTDAMVWATEFQKLVDAGVAIDAGLMVGWFANAIEGGRAASEADAEIELTDEQRARFEAAAERGLAANRARAADGESFEALRRTDGEPIHDEYSWITPYKKDDPWEGLVDDEEDQDPVEYELVRMHVEPLEKRTLGQARSVLPCDEWEGDTRPGRSWLSIEISPDGTGEHWPVNGTSLKHCETQAEADEYIAGLPEEFWVHPGQRPELISRDRLVVEPRGYPERKGTCTKCRWPHPSHGARPTTTEESGAQ